MTDLSIIVLGATILAALACKAGTGPAWRGFVVLLAAGVVGVPVLRLALELWP